MATASKAWFKPLRKSYIATSYKGALSYLPFIAYLVVSLWVPLAYLKPKVVAVFVAIPNWVVAWLLMTFFARAKSS